MGFVNVLFVSFPKPFNEKKVSELVPKICSILNYTVDKRIEDGNCVYKSQQMSDVTVKAQPGGVD